MTPDGGPLGRDAGGGWSPGRGWTPTGRAAASPRPSRSELSLFESAAPGGSATSAVSVKTLVEATRGVVEETLGALWVRGEVTDFKAHRNGQWYFALRDAGVAASLRGVVGRPTPHARRSDDGMAVVAFGQMTMYVARGDLQFRVSAIEPIGEGIHRLARDRTLALLKRDGLLAPERAPRPLPRYPRCVAVVTSLDGAALHDIVAVVRRRAPSVRVVVAPARVQGDGRPRGAVRGTRPTEPLAGRGRRHSRTGRRAPRKISARSTTSGWRGRSPRARCPPCRPSVMRST